MKIKNKGLAWIFAFIVFITNVLCFNILAQNIAYASSIQASAENILQKALDEINASDINFRAKQVTIITPQNYELGLLNSEEEFIVDRKNKQLYVNSKTNNAIYYVKDKRLFVKSPIDSFVYCEIPSSNRIYKLFFATSEFANINPYYDKKEKMLYEQIIKQKPVISEVYTTLSNFEGQVYKIKVQVPAKSLDGIMKEYMKSVILERLKIFNPKASANDIKNWDKQITAYLTDFKFSDLVCIYFIDKKTKRLIRQESFYGLELSNYSHLIKSNVDYLQIGPNVQCPKIDLNKVEKIPETQQDEKGLSS